MEKRRTSLEDTLPRDALALSPEADTAVCGSIDKLEEALYHVGAALA